MPSRIEDYGLIGDCETAALVGRDGSIDWLCWPRFDSGACFAALLGSPEHGRWRVSPADSVSRISRSYRTNTLILETQFETPSGAVTIIDFMPLRNSESHVVRIARCTRGKVQMNMELIVRFDYGQSIPWVTRMEDGAQRAIAGPNMLILRTPASIRGENFKTVGEFTLREGETIPFVLTYLASNLPVPAAIDPYAALENTQAFWEEWSGRCVYQAAAKEVVQRSLITLKALTYWPTGGIIAAPTTSLPEKLGGKRNWDYRFCWLRDATFTLRALMRAGYSDEAAAWQNWFVRAVAGSPDQAQVIYGAAGERLLPEIELNWLPGYEGSKPVRIGNAASEQLQLDVFGEVLGALYRAREAHLPSNEPSSELEIALLAHLEKIWREPDEGIWEVRGQRQHFTHSKVMAWLAFDRAIKSCEEFGLEGPVDQWRSVRKEIHDDVCLRGFDSYLNSFVQHYGAKNADANLLMIAKVGFLPASDPRFVGTVRKIEQDLIRDGFVLRYNSEETDDGLPSGEGVFLPCTFWLADCYALMGRFAEAKALFERLLELRNDVGLFSEEYDHVEKRFVGNFPQAFTHVALINTAFALHLTQEAVK
jgi:GH15 family glucan-1,4-alpha-glucosidase